MWAEAVNSQLRSRCRGLTTSILSAPALTRLCGFPRPGSIRRSMPNIMRSPGRCGVVRR